MTPEDRLWIPQNNVEDISREYARITGSPVEQNHEKYVTIRTPGFFFTRNYINRPLSGEDEAEEIIAQIKKDAAEGKPSLTMFTPKLMPENMTEIFHAYGFTEFLSQLGMNYDYDVFLTDEKDPHIRLISPDEIDAWQDTLIEGFVEEGKQREDVIYHNLVKSPDIYTFAYELDGEIAGTSMLHITGRYAGIHEVAVPQRYRGRKIATKMIVHLLQFAREKGVPGVTLQASQFGRHVYRPLGFKDLYDVQLMVLQL